MKFSINSMKYMPLFFLVYILLIHFSGTQAMSPSPFEDRSDTCSNCSDYSNCLVAFENTQDARNSYTLADCAMEKFNDIQTKIGYVAFYDSVLTPDTKIKLLRSCKTEADFWATREDLSPENLRDLFGILGNEISLFMQDISVDGGVMYENEQRVA